MGGGDSEKRTDSIQHPEDVPTSLNQSSLLILLRVQSWIVSPLAQPLQTLPGTECAQPWASEVCRHAAAEEQSCAPAGLASIGISDCPRALGRSDNSALLK